MLLVSLLTVACTPEPSQEPEPHPCEVDGAGLVCTVAGTGFRGAGGNGLPALDTDLSLPTSTSFTPDGRPLIVDFNNHRIRVLEPDGTLTTLTGNGVHGYAEEGAVATETSLENPISGVMAPDGTLFVQELHGCRILRVDPATGLIWTHAGSGESPGYVGYGGDGGPATEAAMSEAGGMALGDDGTLYFADTGNHCVRKITPDGIIDTVAGDGVPGLTDGVGAAARFQAPQDVAWHDGVLYVADTANDVVRRIDLVTGEVTTVAGTGEGGFGGDGGPAVDAQLYAPRGVGVGPDGAIYVADTENHVVRRIDPVDGTIATVLGQPGQADYDGDGVPPEESLLNWPNDATISAGGDLYVADTFNDRIRVVEGWIE